MDLMSIGGAEFKAQAVFIALMWMHS